MHLYVNGEFAETMDGASFALSGLTGIGHAYNHSNDGSVDPLGGTLLGVSVYDVALDANAIRSNFATLPATDDDRFNTNLFDISGDGNSVDGANIQRDLDGAIVGAIAWNGFENLDKVKVLGDGRFEIVANVLKLKDGRKLSANEQPFAITLEFTAENGQVFEDTLNLNPGSLATVSNISVTNLIQRGERPSVRIEWSRDASSTNTVLEVTDASGEKIASINDACIGTGLGRCMQELSNLDYSQVLTYSFRAENQFGLGSPVTLTQTTQFAPPTVPQDVQIVQTSPTQVKLSWTNAERVQDYFVTWFDEQGNEIPADINAQYQDSCGCNPEVDFGLFDGGVYEMFRPIENLEPDSKYTFEIRAENAYGEGITRVDVRTQPLAVTQISGVQVQATSPTSATLTWSDVDNESAYEVIYASTGQQPKSERLDADATSATITGLSPDTTYEFIVVAAKRCWAKYFRSCDGYNANGTGAVLEDVTRPGDEIIRVDGTNDGDSTAGVPPVNEDVDKAIDNTTRKHLNFIDLNSGFIVTPSLGATVVTGVRVYTANDWEPRDPASYKLEGLNANGSYETISEGPLSLPAARNATGQDLASPNQVTVVDVVSG